MKTFKRKKRRKNWKDPVIGLTHKEYGYRSIRTQSFRIQLGRCVS